MPIDTDALRALLAAAPADAIVYEVRQGGKDFTHDGTDFYDDARAQMGALLDALDAAQARVAALEAERAKTGRECPVCGAEIEGIGDYQYGSQGVAAIKCEACGAGLIVTESVDPRYWIRPRDPQLVGALLPTPHDGVCCPQCGGGGLVTVGPVTQPCPCGAWARRQGVTP